LIVLTIQYHVFQKLVYVVSRVIRCAANMSLTRLVSILARHLLILFIILEKTAAETLRFNVEIHHGLLDPVGNGPRNGILTNGTFPGPELRAKVGDNIEFVVRNRLREDTAIHFHGIKQSTTPWSDGTPGVSQAPIKPGASYMYRWKAEEPGVYFYHGHSRGQIMDGLYGPITIEPSADDIRPFHIISEKYEDQRAMRAAEADIRPLLIADYTQLPFEEFDEIQMASNVEILCMDAIIVNGRVSSSKDVVSS
jgi:FtsP/CotA-like multicopper oxidase with cupredoxin domain